MKKLFLAGISLLFAVSLTFAQDINPEEKAKEKVAILTEQLVLTPEQQEPIHAIVLEAIKTKIAITSNEELNEEAKIELLETNKKEKHDKIKALLTEEQVVAFNKWLEEKKEE